MKLNNKNISLIFVSIFVISLFSTFLYANRTYFTCFSLQNGLILIPIILIISSCILLFIGKNWSYLIASILSFLSFLLLLSLRTIMKLSDDVLFGPSYYLNIILIFIMFTYSYYCFNSLNFFSIKDIVEIGILISLSLVFDQSFLKIRIGQNGGSISLVMLPLCILSLRKGFVKGFIGCGVIFGLISCFLDGYGFFTFPLDYLLGFGSIAVIGIFNKFIINKTYKFKISGLIFLIFSFALSICLRTLFSTLSGIVFYDLQFIPSLAYQLAYILPSSAAVLVLLIILYKPLLTIEKIFR